MVAGCDLGYATQTARTPGRRDREWCYQAVGRASSTGSRDGSDRTSSTRDSCSKTVGMHRRRSTRRVASDGSSASVAGSIALGPIAPAARGTETGGHRSPRRAVPSSATTRSCGPPLATRDRSAPSPSRHPSPSSSPPTRHPARPHAHGLRRAPTRSTAAERDRRPPPRRRRSARSSRRLIDRAELSKLVARPSEGRDQRHRHAPPRRRRSSGPSSGQQAARPPSPARARAAPARGRPASRAAGARDATRPRPASRSTSCSRAGARPRGRRRAGVRLPHGPTGVGASGSQARRAVAELGYTRCFGRPIWRRAPNARRSSAR